MKHGSLFTGIGGFDLAAEWMGWKNVFQVENDESCLKVLEKNFPETKRYKDVTETDFKKYKDKIDIISGGFPCQPHSRAGRQLGSADERDLWYECKRAICEIRPRYALFENVSALLTTERGRFFNRVLSDLASIGYDAEWCCLPASAFGAPHIRERIWIISYPGSIISNRTLFTGNGKAGIKRNQKKKIRSTNRNLAAVGATIFGGIRIDKEWLPEPGIPKLVNGLPGELHEIKQYGNTIVPKIAYQIFKAIEQTHLP